MKLRKCISHLAALLILCSLSISAFATQWSTDDFTVDVPDHLSIFTKETPISDPSWSAAGVDDPASVLKQFKEDKRSVMDIFGGNNNSGDMYAIASFIGDEGKTQILLTRNQTQTSLQYGNSKDMTEEELESVFDALQIDEEEIAEMEAAGSQTKYEQDAQRLEFDGVPFFRLQVDGTGEDGKQMHEIIYMTILNRTSVALHVYAIDEDIPQESEQAIMEIAQSFRVTHYVPPEDYTMSTGDIIRTVGLLVALVLVIVITIIMGRRRTKKDKEQKAKMAEMLSVYHKENLQHDTKGRLCFANVTKCSDEAIHMFSLFHCYIKNLKSIIIGGVGCIALVVISILFSGEWFIILVSLALTAYFTFKVVTSSSSIEKVQKKIYKRGSSNMAKYAFYENSFRVTGIQSLTSYPYFQLTDIQTRKDYIYLYYGPENAYIVSRNGFALNVDPQDFVRFIKDKMKEAQNEGSN